jgi:hypothetical protein
MGIDVMNDVTLSELKTWKEKGWSGWRLYTFEEQKK